MPKALQYRSGSVIYFQGDEADRIFILRTGKVSLVSQDMETGEDTRDPVQPGEFFGVKSALGRYPREENAVAIKDADILAFSIQEFEHFALGNTRIIMKMLHVFSTQLRRVHNQMASLMEEKEQNPEMGLFNVGEYYLNNQRFLQAKYVFNRYLTYYPSGVNAGQAARYLEIAETKLVREAPPPAPVSAPVPAAEKPGFKPPQEEQATETVKAYQDAVNLMTRKKYQQAYMAFKRIEDTNADTEYTAKSSFEIGHCLFLMAKYDDCINYFTVMVTRYSRHPNMGDALYLMGQSYEKRNLKDQAVTFYKKILSLIDNKNDPVYVRAQQAVKAAEA
jgi:CRP-like cAMP-binding protein